MAMRKYPVPTLAAVGLLLGSFATWLLGLPEIGNEVWILTLAVGGVPIVLSTISGLFRRRFAADVIAMLAILAAIVFGEGFAGTVIVLMQSGGEALERYGMGRASSALDSLAARAPKFAIKKEGDAGVQVLVEDVSPGDTLVVRKGDLVPVDGVVLSQEATLDEAALTGEPLPKVKVRGEDVLSGSVNVAGAFDMEATRVSRESEYSKVVELVRHAQERKPRIQRLADRYAVWFTPLAIFTAVAGALVTSDPRTVLSVLVVATPCPLILATPIAVISGVNSAASEGIIVKSGAALEQVADSKVVVFDKTGTLTFGSPSVERVISLGSWKEDEVLLFASSVEQLSSHPIASSLALSGREKFGTLPVPPDFSETPSRGVEGTVNGLKVAVGQRKFCEERMAHGFPSSMTARLGELSVGGKLVTFVSVGGEPGGLVIFTDLVRPGVPEMVQRLRDLGVKQTLMLTGDNKENAEVVSRQTGIKGYEAALLPEGKVREIERLKSSYGNVLMVGDGINDAPALATATVGMAMGARGTAISAEAADIVILVDDVSKVPDALQIGKKMGRIARQGINFGLGASLVLMAVAVFGVIEPAVGATMQEVIDVSVILNALRVR